MENKKKECNLFNNPVFENALKNLTPEQREEYEKIGKYMHSINYTESDPKPLKVDDDMVNGIFYVRESLKSGLHPQDMEEKEIRLMNEVYGPKWYEEYGYTDEDVPKIVEPKLHTVTKKEQKRLAKKLKRKEWKKNNPGKPSKKLA